MYRHVLIATGGAEHSLRAEVKAAALAAELGAKLTIVSVMRLSEMTQGLVTGLPVEAVTLPTDMYEDLQARHRRILEEAAARCSAKGLEPGTVLESGSAGRIIVELAEERGCDLIVVGRRPLSALGAMALGSVSDYVNRHAPCDVLIVR